MASHSPTVVEEHGHAHGQEHDHAHGHDHAPGHGHGPAHLHHHFDDLEQQRETTSLGMWSFLATEVMMFGGLFFAYTLYRARFPGAYDAGSQHLNIWLGTGNTFVLLFSSLTMAMAVHAAVDGNRKRMVNFLIITWLLGAAFLGIKAVEWTVDYHEGLIPGINWSYYDNDPEGKKLHHLGELHTTPHQVLMFFVIYFSMTGLHAIHMIVGLALVGWFAWLGHRGQFAHGNDQPVELLGLYWHLVDIIWVFLFPLLYLIAGFPLLKSGGGGH